MTSKHPAANGGKWIRPDKRLAIYLRDQFTCVYCNANLANQPARLRSLDHVIPVVDGGTNEHTNLVTACKKCNDSKGAKSGFLFISLQYDNTPEGLALVIIALSRVNTAIASPINRTLAKQIIAGTLDLADVLGGN